MVACQLGRDAASKWRNRLDLYLLASPFCFLASLLCNFTHLSGCFQRRCKMTTPVRIKRKARPRFTKRSYTRIQWMRTLGNFCYLFGVSFLTPRWRSMPAGPKGSWQIWLWRNLDHE
jgi:hypothetical protein